MILRIQHDGPVPIYEQIVAQVVYRVAAGAAAPGTNIPSIRDTAKQVLVNPNTVARAYQELERQGVVVARRGMGMEVAPDAVARCRELRLDLVRQRLETALREAVASGLSLPDIRRLVDEALVAINHRPRTKEKN
ncbi:MAG TPA: GntR family transcriptional regulator [Gemmatales bacterium]|nr:GntR family transcriptional regulator [Gemmatales bacterium]HMP58193.1 GntR family transcriptional regulator [Gemmatales bacterium]